MAWRFRKSFSPLPGVRLTLSPSGVSTSVGFGPFRVTSGTRGTGFTANVPGTGLSFRQPIGQPAKAPRTVPSKEPIQYEPVPIQIEPERVRDQTLDDIKSAGSGTLTTDGLGEFRRLLGQSRSEHSQISRELETALCEEKLAVTKYNSWLNGWLFKRIFKQKFALLQGNAEQATALRCELVEQKNLSRLRTQIDMPPGVDKAFHRLCDEFSILSRSIKIWDTVAHRSTNRVIERTTATRTIERKIVSFRMGNCEVIESDWKVPHLANANGGDIFLYPAFVVYFISSDSFALLEYKEIKLQSSPSSFIEQEGVPSDSKVVGKTWAKANKDGSPDKRFNGNYEIPIAQYGKLIFSSTTGLNEEYMISDLEKTENFAKAWGAICNSIKTGV